MHSHGRSFKCSDNKVLASAPTGAWSCYFLPWKLWQTDRLTDRDHKSYTFIILSGSCSAWNAARWNCNFSPMNPHVCLMFVSHSLGNHWNIFSQIFMQNYHMIHWKFYFLISVCPSRRDSLSNIYLSNGLENINERVSDDGQNVNVSVWLDI